MPPPLRRRDPRRALRPVLLLTAVDPHGQPFDERTHAVDVSGTGIRLETAHDLAPGARLDLRILIPRGLQHYFANRPVYSVRAVVRRVERLPDHGRFVVAAQFVAVS
jgi:hypothetical protein